MRTGSQGGVGLLEVVLACTLVAVRADVDDRSSVVFVDVSEERLSTLASLHRRKLINIEGAIAVEDMGDLDPDEFLWEKLPGRCCFYGGPDSLDPTKWLGAHTCAECVVWDLPNNFCHTSRSACEECGMLLYCDPTPPLVAGNKVCQGDSRVGHGCEDVLGTGVCAEYSLAECQDRCRANPKCEMLSFFPVEKQGSCVLCSDLTHYYETQQESTRHTHQHFECHYKPKTELSVDQATGYTDRTAASKEECCSQCGSKSGCQDFVFEPASGTCVLLPHVDSSKIVSAPNEYTISGSLTITVVKQSSAGHGECKYAESSGYAGGQLGIAQPLPGGLEIDSKMDCCDACNREASCAKFTFEPYGKTCMMFEAYAETFLTDGLSSGYVTSRVHGSTHGSSSSGAPSSLGINDDGDEAEDWVPAWMKNPPPPVPPAFISVWGYNQPPPSPPGEQSLTKRLMADVSMGFASLIGFSILTCAYCFFREDFLRVARKASGGKVGMSKRGPDRAAYDVAPIACDSSVDGDDDEGGRTRRKGRRKKGKESRELQTGVVRVRLEANSMSQKKEVDVGTVDDVVKLKEALWAEFGHVLKSKRFEQMILLCEGEGDEGWMLVSKESDARRVVEAGSLKLIEKPAHHADTSYAVAFPRDDGGRRGKRREKAKRFDDASGLEEEAMGGMEQFEDGEASPEGKSNGFQDEGDDGGADAHFADEDDDQDDQERNGFRGDDDDEHSDQGGEDGDGNGFEDVSDEDDVPMV